MDTIEEALAVLRKFRETTALTAVMVKLAEPKLCKGWFVLEEDDDKGEDLAHERLGKPRFASLVQMGGNSLVQYET